jgi:phosphatidylserine/phosphatidylglycerophosphate/cardiolipin synthase-like enzyme
MPRINAIANNDVALVAWQYEQPIAHCLGFELQRIDVASGQVETLPSWVGFVGEAMKGKHVFKPTADWPIQKFVWRDFTATRGTTYRYRVIPRIGEPGALAEAPADQQLTSEPVSLTPACGAGFQAFFNRGIISTQAIVEDLSKTSGGQKPNVSTLKRRIAQAGNETRLRLAGQIIDGVTQLLRRAQANGCECFLALYELTDPELIQLLVASKGIIHLILSNADTTKVVAGKLTVMVDGENQPTRELLHQAGLDVTDRILTAGSSPIGHNKFCVYVQNGAPQAVLLGSTNWTPTGLCAQSNNSLIIESPDVAKCYFEYWQRLQADSAHPPAKRQGQALRAADNQACHAQPPGAAGVDIWFSPNTPWVTKRNDRRPGDMSAVFDAILAAKRTVLFLVFKPGAPNIVDAITAAFVKTPTLFIRGAVTDPSVAAQARTNLFHRAGEPPDEVVPAAAVSQEFAWWEKELLSAGNAIIHDKVVVIDPFDDDCVVVTGSHNLGYKASTSNDENLVLVRGNRALAAAYTAHILDRYDHYRWRFSLQQQGAHAYQGLAVDAGWQTKYFAHGMDAERSFLFNTP